MTPEQEAAALELARTVVVGEPGYIASIDAPRLARAVLHFAEQYEYGIKIRKQIAATLDARDRAFDEALGLLGTIRAERDAERFKFDQETWRNNPEPVERAVRAEAERDALKADYADLDTLNTAITADNAALKADVARLREALEACDTATGSGGDLRRCAACGKMWDASKMNSELRHREGCLVPAALAATAPPESEQGAQPGEAPERGSAG